MFPLKTRKTLKYTFGVPTFYNSFHIGCDYDANYEALYAPFDGGVTIVKDFKGSEAGNVINFWPDHEKVQIRFLHLSKFIKTGRVKEGDLIGITGNTGTSTYRHLHIDISKGTIQLNNRNNFIDPEKYNWNYKPNPPIPIPVKYSIGLVTTQVWTVPQIQEIRALLLTVSEQRLDIDTILKEKTFDCIPFTNGMVDSGWYRNNIWPAKMLHMSNNEWKGIGDGWTNDDGVMFRADEKQTIYFPKSNVTVKAFIASFVHELCHYICRTTGQIDITHQYMHVPDGLFDPAGAYSKVDYSKLK
jgi:hypothetical protein